MPPKKEKVEEAPPPPPVDTNPYGAFITVTIPEARLQLEGGGEGARVFVSVSYAQEWAPLQSEHAAIPADAAAAAVAVPVNLAKAFRAEASLSGLQQLLNASITVGVHDAASGVLLASAPLDMLPLARGTQAFSMSDVQLACAEPSPKSTLQAVSALLPSVSVSLAVRHAPADADPAAPPPPAEQLPEPEPWFFVSPQEAASANVIELVVSGLDPEPAGLLTAAAAAREGKAPGRMTLQLGLGLPGGAPPLLSPVLQLPPPSAPAAAAGQDAGAGGTVGALGGQAVRTRQYITGDQARELLFALEEGGSLHLEVARYLQHDQLQDPRWEHYHAAIQLQGVELLAELGCTSYRPADPLPVRAFASAPGLTTVLPAYVPTNVKGKSIEDANSAEPSGAWEAAGSTATITLSLAAPLAPSWSPPPPPPQPLTSLLALRPRPELEQLRAAAASPPVPATDAFQQLASELGAALKTLARAPAPPASSASPHGAGAAPASGAEEPGVLTARELSAQLRANGRYSAMARALGDAAAAVARERYRAARDAGVAGAPLAPAASQVAALREELFSTLAQQVNHALYPSPSAASATLPTPVDAASSGEATEGSGSSVGEEGAKVARLLALARQCEEAGQEVRAESLHQRRVLLATSGGASAAAADPAPAAIAAAEAWHAYGAFCMRRGKLGRGEECFRQGLASAAAAVAASAPDLEPASASAAAAAAARAVESKCRLALAACLVHQGRATDPLHLSEAEALLSDLIATAAAAAGLAPEASLAGFFAPGSVVAAEPSTVSIAASLAGTAVGTTTATPLVSMAGVPPPPPPMLLLPSPGLGPLAALEPSMRAQVAVLRALLLKAAGDKRATAAAIAIQQLADVEAADPGVEAAAASTPSADPSLSSVSAAAAAAAAATAGATADTTAAAATDDAEGQAHEGEGGHGDATSDPVPAVAAPSPDANPCLAAARWLLGMGLPWLALSSLEHASALPLTGAAVEAEVTLAQAEALHLLGDEESRAQALSLLQGAAVTYAANPAVAAAALELTGHVQFKAGHYNEAVHSYQDALALQDPAAPASSRMYLQLAKAYESLGFPDYALSVYTQACSVTPTAQAWLGVSACRLATGDATAASLALSEAAALDPEDPVVWGRAALLALKSGLKDEAANALKCAVRLGREDIPGALTLPLVSELASEYSKVLGLDLDAAKGSDAAIARRLELQTILWALDSAQSAGTRGVFAAA